MNSKKWIAATFVLVAVAVTLCVVPLIAQAPAAATPSVTNKTYDVWVSQSFASAPFTPFHDCATFTKTKMCLAQCGDCGALSEVQIGATSIWKGSVPCAGLNLVFTGTSISGPQANVIGASSVGTLEGTNFGLEGVQNQSCSLAAAATGKSPYAK